MTACNKVSNTGPETLTGYLVSRLNTSITTYNNSLSLCQICWLCISVWLLILVGFQCNNVHVYLNCIVDSFCRTHVTLTFNALDSGRTLHDVKKPAVETLLPIPTAVYMSPLTVYGRKSIRVTLRIRGGINRRRFARDHPHRAGK